MPALEGVVLKDVETLARADEGSEVGEAQYAGGGEDTTRVASIESLGSCLRAISTRKPII